MGESRPERDTSTEVEGDGRGAVGPSKHCNLDFIGMWLREKERTRNPL